MDEITQQIENLAHDNVHQRWEAVSALADAADAGVDLAVAVPALATALADENPHIRGKAAYTLVSIAEHAGDISSAVPALAGALADESEVVRKEAVWALYCLAGRGQDLGPAAGALAEAVEKDSSRSVRGNGAIGLALDYLNAGKPDEAAALLKHADGNVLFGAAWAHADFYRRTQDRDALKALIGRVRPGLLDLSLRDGIVGSIAWAEERGEDVSFDLGIIQEMLAQAGDDAVAQAPLYGILMRLRSGD
jgi:hypothetical protein